MAEEDPIILPDLPQENKTRHRDPKGNELQVYEFLRSIEGPASFHEIQTALSMTPGALQATIKRSLDRKADYQIFESSMISPKTNRKIRIFSWNPEILPEPEDVIDTGIFSGKMIDTPDKTAKILPLRMENPTVEILNNLVDLVPDYANIGELFSLAITQYLRSIPNDLILQALNKDLPEDQEDE
ncbi:hypothetical protein [Candidatus Lokiarchaeum ossiferum]|uniref:hypothetical protein n=1 Tax=Candidatus Lokiarchaeum ossiferum TaxID=2951803 RepID=UPI00352FD476